MLILKNDIFGIKILTLARVFPAKAIETDHQIKMAASSDDNLKRSWEKFQTDSCSWRAHPELKSAPPWSVKPAQGHLEHLAEASSQKGCEALFHANF